MRTWNHGCTEPSTSFEIHELSEVEKVKVPVVSFTEDEVNWFCWSHTRSPTTTWEELKKRMHV